MTDETQLPTRQAIAAKDRSAPLQVTGKLKHALDLMIWKGLARDQAAEAAGLKPHSLYVAFRKSHVKAAYLSELEVLRTSERARNIHALVEVRDGKDHTNPMARVTAAKALEGLGDDLPAGFADPRQQPGITIRIINQAPASPAIDITPARPALPRQIEHDDELAEPAFKRRPSE